MCVCWPALQNIEDDDFLPIQRIIKSNFNTLRKIKKKLNHFPVLFIDTLKTGSLGSNQFSYSSLCLLCYFMVQYWSFQKSLSTLWALHIFLMIWVVGIQIWFVTKCFTSLCTRNFNTVCNMSFQTLLACKYFLHRLHSYFVWICRCFDNFLLVQKIS